MGASVDTGLGVRKTAYFPKVSGITLLPQQAVQQLRAWAPLAWGSATLPQ